MVDSHSAGSPRPAHLALPDFDENDSDARRQHLAAALLFIEAVTLSPRDPFLWSSGLRAPIYCDNRLTLGHPPVRARIAEGFAALIQEQRLDLDAVAGTATAGIPHAAWLAERLDLPMVYVRGKAKQHGRGKQVEGGLPDAARVVVIEDLVSTGQSSIDVVRALREAGAQVEAVLAIFSYGLPAARRRFDEAGVPLHTLTDFDALLTAAEKGGTLDADERQLLDDWKRDPEGWSERHG